MIIFRAEKSGDAEKIHALVANAFGRQEEAELVDQLCADGDALVSLVAVDDESDTIVGHILFSDLPIETGRSLIRGAALAPLAVSPAHQKQGIAGGLVMRGIRDCRALDVVVVVVLGDPSYYKRFGFSSELTQSLESPYGGEAFMAQELKLGVLTDVEGKVIYAEAFSAEAYQPD